MTLPTILARTAVRKLHRASAASAKQYLRQSKVGEWANHSNQSMATNNQRVLDGFDWYVQQDAADGRPMSALDQSTVVNLQGFDVETRIDVVLNDGSDLAARVVFWDAPTFDDPLASTMACAYAHALQLLYPGRNFTKIGIWQARSQYLVEVPYANALARTRAAAAVLATM
jgi:hypothetical protein